MITDLSEILIEWSYRTHDGIPDVNNNAKLILLENILKEYGWIREARDELLNNLMTEDDIVKNKESGTTYTVKNHNPETQDLITKDASEDEIEKAKKDDDEEDKKDDNDEEAKLKAKIDAKIKEQTDRFDALDLDEHGVPKKKPENVKWGSHKDKIISDLNEVDDAVQSSTVIPKEDKQNISSAIKKINDDKVDDMSDDEISAMRKWIGVKDQSGNPDVAKRTTNFYVADINPNDWRFGKASVGGGEPARQARKKIPDKKPYGLTKDGSRYDEFQKVREAIGLKSAAPTNSRTTSKMMAPTTTNPKRKKETIKTKEDDNGRVTEVTISGQTHTRKNVPKINNVKKELISKGIPADQAEREARSVVFGIQRYNDQLDLLGEAKEVDDDEIIKYKKKDGKTGEMKAREAKALPDDHPAKQAWQEESDLEIVDYGDVSTIEGRKGAISQCLQNVANGMEKALERTTPPHPPMTKEHYVLIEYIKKVKNPLDDPNWEGLPFEERQKKIEKFEQEMGQILSKMNELGDMMTSRAEVAESMTFMHRLSQGYNAILPASETFKVTDVFAIKDPGDTSDPKVVADSIQQILVNVEAAGGESVKFEKGARSSSAGKTSLTVYKNKKTRTSISSLLDTYDKIYNSPDGYPPSDKVIKELDDVRDSTKAQVVEDGIMTGDEYDTIYEGGMKTGEKSFDSFEKKNQSALEKAGFTEEELERVKDSFKKHCAHGNVMAEINNRDTKYNKFNNVSHKIKGEKKGDDGKIIKGSGKYETEEMDGINTISGMDFSCDQGFQISKPGSKNKTIKPKNTNPSAIIALDPNTGKPPKKKKK
jgi:hypothetical protein